MARNSSTNRSNRPSKPLRVNGSSGSRAGSHRDRKSPLPTDYQLKLFEESILIRHMDPEQADQLAFAANVLIQCSLPVRDPKEVFYVRQNGNLSVTIQPHIYGTGGKIINTGIPYGRMARLLLLYATTFAVQNKTREVSFGSSMNEWMNELDLSVSGGKRGTTTALKRQVKRLFSSTITATVEGEEGLFWDRLSIGEKGLLFWEPGDPKTLSLFKSKILLSDRFYEMITSGGAVPLDMRVLRLLQSPLAIDVYSWLAYRVSRLKGKKVVISWEQLSAQFGTEYGSHYDFAKRFKAVLKQIQPLWRGELRVSTPRGRLVIHPESTTPVAPKKLEG